MTSLPSNPESERKALVKRVWDQCWEEFHSWKAKFASEEMAAAAVGRSAALQVKLEQDSQPDVAPPATGRNRFDINEELNEVPLSSGNQLLTVWSFPVVAAGESGDIVPTGHRIPVYPCDPIKDISKPVAPYESCVLLSQNVQFTDTAAEFEVMEFMPFGNEAAFRRKNPDFLKDEETGGKRFTFKWDMPDRDPDVDVVMCEAARRLHTDHGLSFGEIDSAEVLPRSLVMDDGSIWNPFILRYARSGRALTAEIETLP
ncbi:hypothetical protein FRC05_010505 [Tulasnella sp. 425]|nr:hypothetical protein FRC05_010505 [Tulasnella sp. 425]